MAWPATGGLFTNPWKSLLQQVANQTMDLDTHVFNVALYNNSVSATPFSVVLASAVYLVGDWVTGNEMTGTGWVAGGYPITSPSVTESPTGTLMWSGGNISQAGTTLSTVYGCLIYDTNAGLTAKYGVCAIPFGAAYTTTAGTFGITWAAAGILNIKLV